MSRSRAWAGWAPAGALSRAAADRVAVGSQRRVSAHLSGTIARAASHPLWVLAAILLGLVLAAPTALWTCLGSTERRW
jgi:hypothetical protein